MNIDDIRKDLAVLSFTVMVIQLADLLIVLFTPMKESFPSFTVYFVLFNIALVFFLWLVVTDVQWRFAMLFVGGAMAMEYFAKLAGLKNPVEAKFIAAFGILMLVFTTVSLLRFRKAPYYYILKDEKGFMWLKIAVVSYAGLFVVANFLGI
jgi:hypothetical protein